MTDGLPRPKILPLLQKSYTPKIQRSPAKSTARGAGARGPRAAALAGSPIVRTAPVESFDRNSRASAERPRTPRLRLEIAGGRTDAKVLHYFT